MNSEQKLNSSQKKTRKSLRSQQRIHAPLAETKEDKPKVIQRKSKKAKLDVNRDKSIATPTKASDKNVTIQRDPDIDCNTKVSEIGKDIPVKSKPNVSSKSASSQDGGSSSKTSVNNPVLSESELSDCSEDHMDVLENQSINLNDDQNVIDDNRSELLESPSIRNIAEYQDNVELEIDTESEDFQDNCFEDVWKEVNKDIGALYTKTNKIEADLKEIKQILLARPSQHCIRTISSRFKQKTSFSLLPKLPLLKKSAVRNMNANFVDEDNEEYRDQLVSLFLKYLIQHTVHIYSKEHILGYQKNVLLSTGTLAST